MFDQETLIKLHRPRANLIANVILFMFSLILARLWYLQVYRGKQLLNYSLQNRLRREEIEAPRGMFFDRNGVLIVDNVPRFDAVIIPQYLQHKKETIKKLSEVLEIPDEMIYKTLSKKSNLASYKPVIIKKNISRKEVAVIETQNDELPGVAVDTCVSREYIDREVGGHLLGYISEISSTQLPKYRNRDNIDYKLGDFIGQAGLEEQLDLYIRGQNGYEFVEVDATGRRKFRPQSMSDGGGEDDLFREIKDRPAVPGPNVTLTIDRDMQLSAYNALKGKEGAVIAVDVNTGEILAMVSLPSFDPSLFSKGFTSTYWRSLTRDPRRPLRDRVIQEHYSPGSTFKPLVALAGLEENAVDEKTEISCTGQFPLGRKVFHCWKKHGHGPVDTYRSIRESCDIFYYRLGKRLDIDTIAHYVRALGLGRKTGVGLPHEVGGLIPDREWKKKRSGEEWMLGDTISCVIGQSYVLVTPLQLAMAYSVIANGGKLFRPYVVKKIFYNSGEVVKSYSPELISEVKLHPKALAVVREGLRQVVNEPKGTAYSYGHGKGLGIAGKTGTAQVIKMSAEKLFSKCEEAEYKFRHHALFVGYAPYDEPKIAVAVVIEHGCHGASAGVPIVVDVVSTYMKKYFPELHKKYLQQEKAKGILMKAPPPKNIIQEEEDTEVEEDASYEEGPVGAAAATGQRNNNVANGSVGNSGSSGNSSSNISKTGAGQGGLGKKMTIGSRIGTGIGNEGVGRWQGSGADSGPDGPESKIEEQGDDE
ncbi:MAG: penicillin-binding protein 2 [Oligoflexia bacterium]|nr:penicillin-binding protein 2 [Oligoflexia bacterium]